MASSVLANGLGVANDYLSSEGNHPTYMAPSVMQSEYPSPRGSARKEPIVSQEDRAH